MKITDDMIKRIANAFVSESWLQEDWDNTKQASGHVCPECGDWHHLGGNDPEEIVNTRNTIRFFLEEALNGDSGGENISERERPLRPMKPSL